MCQFKNINVGDVVQFKDLKDIPHGGKVFLVTADSVDDYAYNRISRTTALETADLNRIENVFKPVKTKE